jgi:hypothetical protein
MLALEALTTPTTWTGFVMWKRFSIRPSNGQHLQCPHLKAQKEQLWWSSHSPNSSSLSALGSFEDTTLHLGHTLMMHAYGMWWYSTVYDDDDGAMMSWCWMMMHVCDVRYVMRWWWWCSMMMMMCDAARARSTAENVMFYLWIELLDSILLPGGIVLCVRTCKTPSNFGKSKFVSKTRIFYWEIVKTPKRCYNFWE